MKNKIFFITIFALLAGCSKSNRDIVLSTNLTGCPINTTCIYSYKENSDFTASTQLVNGTYRVFGYTSVNKKLCDLTIQLYFKTSLSNNDFLISSDQIGSGEVVIYNSICACCDFDPNFKPIGGEIKGKRTDATHWLINAKVIMGVSNKPLDTLVINNYYTKN